MILKKKTYRSTPNRVPSRGSYYRTDPNAKIINLNNLVKPVYGRDPIYKEGEGFISKRALHAAEIVNSYDELKNSSSYSGKVKYLKTIKVENGTIYYSFDDEKWLTEKEMKSNYVLAFTMSEVWPLYLEINKKLRDIRKQKEQEIFMAEKQKKIDHRRETYAETKAKNAAAKVKLENETSAADKISSMLDGKVEENIEKVVDKTPKVEEKKTEKEPVKKSTKKKSTKTKKSTTKKTK